MSGSAVSTTPQTSGHLDVGALDLQALDLLPERKLVEDARARDGAKGPPHPDNPQFWDSTSQVGQSQGAPTQPGALGPTKTNSSLDDSGMRMVMPIWQSTPGQLAIPKNQPPAPAADRWNKALSKPPQPAPPLRSPGSSGMWHQVRICISQTLECWREGPEVSGR